MTIFEVFGARSVRDLKRVIETHVDDGRQVTGYKGKDQDKIFWELIDDMVLVMERMEERIEDLEQKLK